MKLNSWFKNNYCLTIVLCIAAILRFYHIDYQSVWLDEVHTLNEANPSLSLSELYDAVLQSDPHPPLYFILVHFVFQMFGYTSIAMRMFSAILGVVGVWIIYLFGKEIFNKEVGLHASLLLTVNYFHLFYSQEARMYSLLFLTTTLSFYYLVRFIKRPTIKAAIVYGMVATLMIYCQFAALFALFSQYLILLFFTIKPFNSTRKNFFYCSAISGIITFVLYLPVLKIFNKAAQRTSIWISMPTEDVYTQMFKEFFGQSEMVLFFVLILVGVFFIQLFNETGSERFQLDPDKDRLVFGFVILFVWISVCLILPLIRTYTALPMLISRYFINILPAVIIIVSIGLFFVKNEIVRKGCLGFIVIFSLTDIIIVKKYYSAVTKEQFREVSRFIIDNNSIHDPVVTNLGWYFPYFLNNENVKTNIINKPLEEYVNEMMADSTKGNPFWYAEISGHPIGLTETGQKYLDSRFLIENSIDVYRGRAIHYSQVSSAFSEIDIAKFRPFKNRNGDDFTYYVDQFEVNSGILLASGYAYFNNQDASESVIETVLVKNERAFMIRSKKDRRDDVTTYFKSHYDLGNSGFTSKLLINKLTPGKYQFGIILRNKKTAKEGLVLCDNFFTKE